MRAFTGILVVAAITGCRGSEPFSPSQDDPDLRLSIQLNVSGDPSTAPATFGTTLDGEKWRDIIAGDNRFGAISGLRVLALAPLSPRASWCTPIGQTEHRAMFRKDGLTTVTFNVDCPPLVGTGTLTVYPHVSAVGSNTPVRVGFVRMNGPAVATSILVLTDQPTDVTLPVGVYGIEMERVRTCTLIEAMARSSNSIRAVVREGESATVNAVSPC